MVTYLISFFYGICLLLSLIGWGKFLNHILFPNQETDWGQRAGWGLALSLIIGGVLNATWNISPPTILIFLGLGLIYCLVDLVNHRQSIASNLSQLFQESRQDKIILAGLATVSLLILIQYAGWIYIRETSEVREKECEYFFTQLLPKVAFGKYKYFSIYIN